MMLEVQNGTVQTRNRRDLPEQAPDVEHQEIGDGEADDQRDRPDDQRVFERAQIQSVGEVGSEQLDVVAQGELGNDVEHVVVEEADHDHQGQRNPEEDQENQSQRQDLEVRDQALGYLHRSDDGWRNGAGRPEPPRARRRAGQAAMNSFQRWIM